MSGYLSPFWLASGVPSWTDKPNSGALNWTSFDICDGGLKLLATTTSGAVGAIYNSTDGLATAIVQYTGSPAPGVTKRDSCCLNTAGTYMLSSGLSVRSYSTNGTSWINASAQNGAPTATFVAINKAGTNNIDGTNANTFIRVNNTAPGKTHGITGATGATIDTTGAKCVVVSSGGGCKYTTNLTAGTPTFTTCTGLSGDVRGASASSDGSKVVAAKYADGIYRSTDSGANFSILSAFGTENFIGCRTSSDGTIIIGWTASKILRSVDSGATVTDITFAGASTIPNCGMSADGLWVISANVGGNIQIGGF